MVDITQASHSIRQGNAGHISVAGNNAESGSQFTDDFGAYLRGQIPQPETPSSGVVDGQATPKQKISDETLAASVAESTDGLELTDADDILMFEPGQAQLIAAVSPSQVEVTQVSPQDMEGDTEGVELLLDSAVDPDGQEDTVISLVGEAEKEALILPKDGNVLPAAEVSAAVSVAVAVNTDTGEGEAQGLVSAEPVLKAVINPQPERSAPTDRSGIPEMVDGSSQELPAAAKEDIAHKINKAEQPIGEHGKPGVGVTELRTATPQHLSSQVVPSVNGDLQQQFDQLLPQSLTAARSAVASERPAATLDSAHLNSHLPASLKSPEWSSQMGERVLWMAQGKFHSAELQLNPARLGPLEVRLSVSDDQATISFVSTHSTVRDAVEQAIPRLREMLEQNGLNLANVDVSQHSKSGNGQTGEFGGRSVKAPDEVSGSGDGEAAAHVSTVTRKEGLSIYA